MEDLIKKLENLKMPEIEIQSHRQKLKMALLNSGYFKEKTTMFLLKKFAPIGAVAVIALVLVIGFGLLKQPTPDTYAKELIAKTEAAVLNHQGNITLLPKNAISYTASPELVKEWVVEAKEAEDLRYLGKETIDGKYVEVLSYTDSKGNSNILKIDKDNLPVSRSIVIKDEAGKKVAGIEFGKAESFEMEVAKKKEGKESEVKYELFEPSSETDCLLFADLLKNYVAKKDQRVSELTKGSNWQVIKVIRSAPEKTETGMFVKTVTVVLEREGKQYEITFNLTDLTVESIK